ncbi:4-hydroxy-tetrahydrodipicolinate reductase [Fodinisporobacter ferrooxydans]|uniref:4-hydroxy-tetrahydrodipicolinate reductase n=1 Tax=Fodinisporobacter ferrooxydans TaxID=2901836 RepID=A0ABY4CGP5_9BACL|nr:4-hydroxy-tetrahydrodipicolinate reductase [Alicyclobacillaceae bacterium MYW30-H2]
MSDTRQQRIRVAIAGAKGRMGREFVKTVLGTEDLELAGAIDRTLSGVDVGEVIGIGATGTSFTTDLERLIAEQSPDVLVDLTTPQVVKEHAELAIRYGTRPVIGTTGITLDDVKTWDRACRQREIGGLIAPNFAIGAILMMQFAKQAAKYLPHVEIIEMHHDKKLDAPSGTAQKTAEMIAEVRESFRQGHPDEEERLRGARGAELDGIRIHSVRLPGYVAHQEVLFGSTGQALSIRHDSFSRESFMPGIVLACRKVMTYTGMVYGLENLLQ